MIKKTLIKLSGKLIDNDIFMELIEDLHYLRKANHSLALVHGGGKIITQYLDSQQIASKFIDGLRVTESDAIKIVEMVLAGLINKQLTRWLNAANIPAVGISGSDLNLIEACMIKPELGHVGRVENINPQIVDLFWKNNLFAVIAPTGTTAQGDCLNINADMSAGALACALSVDNLIYFTDANGVLINGKKIDTLSAMAIPEFISKGIASEGMIPKLEACKIAKESGISKIKIARWAGKGSLLEALGSENIGTEII
ncbi:acetylglutamate kinase [candidate division KSB1 bacterium]|nr:acetylglutamate kinase [candidate division KSB1 bacterium]